MRGRGPRGAAKSDDHLENGTPLPRLCQAAQAVECRSQATGPSTPGPPDGPSDEASPGTKG